MKKRHYSKIILVLVISGCSCVVAGEEEDKARIWEQYSIHTYSNLNTRLNGALTPIFRSLGDFRELQQYFDKDRNPEKYEAYRQFVVHAFADANQGDVVEAMFADVLLELTPAHILLRMIAPEIGQGGQLEGILRGKHSDVAKHIQRQPQQGHIGRPNFIEYVRYLKGGRGRGYTSQTNAEAIVLHMFETDPQEAFAAMLWADYGFNPHSRYPYLDCKNDMPQVRKLQIAYADISDYLYRSRYDLPKHPFPYPEGLEDKVRAHLKNLADHDRWWVRLYVAYLLKTERMLRWPDAIDKADTDQDPAIQGVMNSIKLEDPGFTRRPNKAIDSDEE